MFYSLCEDGISAIGDVCGLFSSVDENVNEKKQADEVTSDEWLQTTSKAVFYADHDVKPDNLCGSSDPSLSADNGKDALLKMALNAARLKHSLRNLKYDETQSMNVKKDVKVVELRVGIPIGGWSLLWQLISIPCFHFISILTRVSLLKYSRF